MLHAVVPVEAAAWDTVDAVDDLVVLEARVADVTAVVVATVPPPNPPPPPPPPC